MPECIQRIALVSGANRGIGFEISRQIAKQGVTVVMGVRNLHKGSSACGRLAKNGLDVDCLVLDVNDPESIRDTLEHISKHFGRLDILVNNAGIMIDREATVMTIDLDRVRETMQTNFYGPMLLCQCVIPLMRKHGYGRIVNISSTLGSFREIADLDPTDAGMQSPAYRMSKNALNSLTALVAREVRGENILINSACPGWVQTDMGGQRAPLTPEQGADTPVWLATLPDDGPSGGFFRERKLIPW
jgi:NAD(P)-dependent dehydrogenase (short-subunit alcohol dehydrogenase family)